MLKSEYVEKINEKIVRYQYFLSRACAGCIFITLNMMVLGIVCIALALLSLSVEYIVEKRIKRMLGLLVLLRGEPDLSEYSRGVHNGIAIALESLMGVDVRFIPSPQELLLVLGDPGNGDCR